MRRNLGCFVRRFDGCVKTRPSRKHLRTYVGGQVSDVERKSIEPIALEAGVRPRTLQKFLEEHRWDHGAVSRRQRAIVMRDHADESAIAVVDETSFAKKGDKTAAVQRQHCGSTGKTDNCVVSVHLGYVTEDFQCLVDEDVYLPEESWHANRARCRAAKIPDEVVYRPKWQIAVDILKRSIQEGVRFKYLTADELYGGCGEFRREATGLGLTYVVETPCSTYGWTSKPPVVEAEPYAGSGRPRTRAGLAGHAAPPRRVDQLWRRGGPSWSSYHVKNTEKGPLVWQARIARVWISRGRLSPEEAWLIVARNPLDGKVKYFLSNAPMDTPIELMLHIAFSRAAIERLFEDAKGQVGLDHFEVRHYTPLIRHLILSRVSLLFLQKETKRLREKKNVVESQTSAARSGSAA
jgi:SRSO17 transposase